MLQTSLGRVAVAICYDSFFPEMMRTLVLAGADLIAIPTNNPVLGPELTPLPTELLQASTTALVNRVYIAQADRTGRERGVEWVGSTAIVDPTGLILTERLRTEGVLTADFEQALARDKRLSERMTRSLTAAPSCTQRLRRIETR